MQVITVLMTAATAALAGTGGPYYSFACSVMPGLRATDDATFVTAMARINAAIQNPVFALSFVGAFAGLAVAGSAGARQRGLGRAGCSVMILCPRLNFRVSAGPVNRDFFTTCAPSGTF